MNVKCVCFDLGGVLVRICTDWQQAASRAQVSTTAPPGSLATRPEFDLYQSGEIDDADYLAALGSHLGVSDPECARKVHDAILIEAFDGTLELVRELESRGVSTGCLSNTNALHWQQMTQTGRFPAIERLHTKVASQIVKASKPDPAIYRAFESASGHSPEEILNFDDVETYVLAARQAGWNAVQIDPTKDTALQMRQSLVTFGLL